MIRLFEIAGGRRIFAPLACCAAMTVAMLVAGPTRQARAQEPAPAGGATEVDAKDIAAKGRVSLRAVKQAINQGLNVDLVSGCHIEVDAFAIALASPDAKEGTAAFLEKRKPVFKAGLKG
jgi:enoyl-CoA hydratase/carnithine racemase